VGTSTPRKPAPREEYGISESVKDPFCRLIDASQLNSADGLCVRTSTLHRTTEQGLEVLTIVATCKESGVYKSPNTALSEKLALLQPNGST
jgi:hypothetical protein